MIFKGRKTNRVCDYLFGHIRFLELVARNVHTEGVVLVMPVEAELVRNQLVDRSGEIEISTERVEE